MTQLGGNNDLQGIVKKIEILTYYQMVLAQTRISPIECNAYIFWDF